MDRAEEAELAAASAAKVGEMRILRLIVLWMSVGLLSACGPGQAAGTTAAPTATRAALPTATATAFTPAAVTPATGAPAFPSLAPNPNVQDPSFTALPGAKAYFGQVAGSGYRIEMPDRWNGDLVLYAHGYRGTTPQLTITNLPVREPAIQQGFAWAASSYRANGYNPEDGVQDTLILRQLFVQKFGAPKHTYLYGSSMGGHVVVASLEQYPDVYAAGLSECGAVSGIGEFDYLLSYVLLGGYFAGVDPTALRKGDVLGAGTLLKQIYAALGDAPERLTPKGVQFRSAIINLTGGHRPFAVEGFAERYRTDFEGGLGVLLDPSYKGRAATNVDARYHVDEGLGVSDEQLNAGVKRVAADPNARNAGPVYEFTPFKGNLKIPLLTIHDVGDFFVPISLEQQYRATVAAAGASERLVERAVRRFSHCDFSAAERGRAWNDLVAWATGGQKPEGEELSGSLADAGRKFTEPVRPDDPGQP